MPERPSSAVDSPTLVIEPFGDAALLARVAPCDQAERRLAAGLVDACRRGMLAGVTDVVQAFDVVGVYYDPRVVVASSTTPAFDAVSRWVRDRWGMATQEAVGEKRAHTIPVCYDDQFAPDLTAVADHAGISTDECIRRHSGAEYVVGAVGFAPGFAYLEGLPDELQAPRRGVPRTRVPAGAVAIGGPYTAVYPNASPGGWNLIGRCPLRLFDPLRDPPTMLQAGDRVRFQAIGRERFDELRREAEPTVQPRVERPPVLRVVSPGVQSSLQDLGRAGARRWGVAAGGAMDAPSLQLANALVGNPLDALALEATLVGPVLECLADVEVGVSGGVPDTIGPPRRLSLRAGDKLDLRGLTSARAYVAVAGGFAGDRVLGGAGTDLQAGFGGVEGRALAAGDLLTLGGSPPPTRSRAKWFVARTIDPMNETVVVRVLRTRNASIVDNQAWRRFITSEHHVSSDSNRMGIRLVGPGIKVDASSAASLPMTPGAVQVPPEGEPIVLAVDSQTLGGYPVVACVATVDLPKLGQLQPAAVVRFVDVTMEQAACFHQAADRQLSITLAGVTLANKDV